MGGEGKKVKLAAIGDLHVREGDEGKWRNFFKQVSEEADILLICGDLTDKGLLSEASILAKDLEECKIPVIAVLGNHDCELNLEDEIKKILHNDHVFLLDGESIKVKGIGFAGIKGFGGGFGKYMLPLWGEKMNKQYVQEAVNNALKLDQALTRLTAEKKVVVLHYAPIPETLAGEHEQLYPFLGSGRLEDPINQRQVLAVFHGHAHSGTLEGNTSYGVKVFNVSAKVLKKAGLNKPYFLYEI